MLWNSRRRTASRMPLTSKKKMPTLSVCVPSDAWMIMASLSPKRSPAPTPTAFWRFSSQTSVYKIRSDADTLAGSCLVTSLFACSVFRLFFLNNFNFCKIIHHVKWNFGKLFLCPRVIYNVHWAFNDYITCSIIMFLHVCDNGLFVVILY